MASGRESYELPEDVPPGHPPLHDIELDIDALKAAWKDRPEMKEPPVGNYVRPVSAHHHSHAHASQRKGS